MSTPYSHPGQNPYAGGPGAPQPGFPQQHAGPPNYAKVTAPAIALIVVGVIDILHALFAIGSNILSMFIPRQNQVPPQFQADPQMVAFLQNFGPVINILIAIVMLLLSALLVYGAVMMLQRRNYGLAMTAAVIAMVPCTGIMTCCLVEIGFGIWALIILLGDDVKGMFR